MICKQIVWRKHFKMSQSWFDCAQLNGFKYSKWLNSSIRPMDGTLTGTTTPGQSGHRSNDNKGALHILQDWSLTIRCSLVSYPRHSVGGEKVFLPLCRDAVSIFYSPSQLSWYMVNHCQFSSLLALFYIRTIVIHCYLKKSCCFWCRNNHHLVYICWDVCGLILNAT